MAVSKFFVDAVSADPPPSVTVQFAGSSSALASHAWTLMMTRSDDDPTVAFPEWFWTLPVELMTSCGDVWPEMAI